MHKKVNFPGKCLFLPPPTPFLPPFLCPPFLRFDLAGSMRPTSSSGMAAEAEDLEAEGGTSSSRSIEKKGVFPHFFSPSVVKTDFCSLTWFIAVTQTPLVSRLGVGF